jgi:hypothetical protein
MASHDPAKPKPTNRLNGWLLKFVVGALVLEVLLLVGIYAVSGQTPNANPGPTPPPAKLADVAVQIILPTGTPTASATFTATATATATLTPTLTPRPPMPTAPDFMTDEWKNLPVLPVVSPAMKEIYARGLALGNDPHAFSKVGDCNSESVFYLTPFEDPETYRLGTHEDLQPMIDNFAGSFGRLSIAAHTGFGPSSMFSPIWADPEVCKANEGPLGCEFRIHRPSIVIIGLGTHHYPTDDFERQMRAVIEYALDNGVVPIIATKVDEEGGDWVNAMVVYIAQQYDVPIWNFWRSVQHLENKGQPDEVHFTWASNYFDSGYAMANGWPIRNLGALMALNEVWTTVASP